MKKWRGKAREREMTSSSIIVLSVRAVGQRREQEKEGQQVKMIGEEIESERKSWDNKDIPARLAFIHFPSLDLPRFWARGWEREAE